MPDYVPPPALTALLEHQLGFFTEQTHRSLDALRRLSALNLRLGQQLMEVSVDTGRALMDCATPLQVGPVVLRHSTPIAQHLRNYQLAWWAALNGVQSALAHSTRARVPETVRVAAAVMEDFTHQTTQVDPAVTRH